MAPSQFYTFTIKNVHIIYGCPNTCLQFKTDKQRTDIRYICRTGKFFFENSTVRRVRLKNKTFDKRSPRIFVTLALYNKKSSTRLEAENRRLVDNKSSLKRRFFVRGRVGIVGDVGDEEKVAPIVDHNTIPDRFLRPSSRDVWAITDIRIRQRPETVGHLHQKNNRASCQVSH